LAIAVFSVVGLMWYVQRLYTSPLCAIRYVHILGNDSKQVKNTLQKTVAPLSGNGLFQISAKALESELKGWDCVERITLWRIFPCLLIIRVYTRVPIAIFQSDVTTVDQPTQWLDKTGFIFTSAPQITIKQLPRLIGSKEQATHLLRRYQALDALLKNQALQVDIIRLDTENRCYIELSNGIRLLFGHLDPCKQLQKLLHAHPFVLHQADKIAALDLRYSTGMAITWRESTI
jgi:cell division septal protein FtsQ